MMNTHIPRLHMGCGESLRSSWLLGQVQAERKALSTERKAKTGKPKRERTRG